MNKHAFKELATQPTQRGAALLSAMLTVTLVATFAAAALWQQYRSIEVEASERARVQVAWLLVGALDWSRLILRIDGSNAKTSASDHLAEPWAVALPESRLSTFLAADQNNTGGMTAEESVDVFLSGQMTDAQSFLNVYNLVDAGRESLVDKAAFVRLFDLLKLPAAELDTLVKNLKIAKDVSAVNGNAALMPERVRQLTWLGLSTATLAKLSPYITLISQRTTVNLNTASAEVIYASVPDLQLADAKLVVFARQSKPFGSIDDAKKAVKALGQIKDTEHSVVTRFFQVMGRLRLEQTVVEEQSLVSRDNFGNVRTLWRERAVVSSPEPSASNTSTGLPPS
jgi:general secretion pathway protein K